MHFEGIWSTMEGRHLVLAYAAVLLIQGGYFGWILLANRRLRADRQEASGAGRPPGSGAPFTMKP